MCALSPSLSLRLASQKKSCASLLLQLVHSFVWYGVAVFAQSVTHNVCALSFTQPAPCQSKKILRQPAANFACY
jgi:hypothetical protein